MKKKKNKIKFSHFEDDNGNKVKSIQIYLGNLNINEWLDDVECEMEIVDGDIKFTILNQQYYDKEELVDIQDELKHVDWDGGYDFIDFVDINTNIAYWLIGDRTSDVFDVINSPQNIQNINNFSKNFK